MKKIVLITGCSSGFGRLLVTSFLEKGWSVIATMRNVPAREKIFNSEKQKFGDTLQILNFDVTSDADLKSIVQYLTQNGGLDCLINNAGYGVFSALEDASEKQISDQIDINVTGLILTTRALLPFLRHSKGHVINFSSVLGFSTLPLTSLYCGTKYAVEGFSESLYFELLPHKVRLSIVEPGAFATEFKDNVIYGELSESKDSPYFWQSENYKNYTKDFLKNQGDPRVVVSAVMKAVDAANPPLRIRCGKDARMVYLAKSLVPAPFFRLLSRFFFEKTINRVRSQK